VTRGWIFAGAWGWKWMDGMESLRRNGRFGPVVMADPVVVP